MVNLPERSLQKTRTWISLIILLLTLAACQPPDPVVPTPDGGTQDVVPTQVRPATPTPLPPTPTPYAGSPLGVEAGDLQGVQVAFWHPWMGETERVINELVSEFNAVNANRIQVTAVGQGSLDRLSDQLVRAGESESPNLVTGYFHQAAAWEAAGRIVDLNPYMLDPEWGLSAEEQADFYPVFWEQDVWDGKRLGVPALRSGAFLYYNAGWAKELGFSGPPETPEALMAQACAAAEASRQGSARETDLPGGLLISTEYPAVLGWMNAFGAGVVAPGRTGYQFETASVQEAFTFLRDLYDRGCAWVGEGRLEAEFAERKALLAAGSMLGLAYQQAVFEQVDDPDEWTAIPFPSPGQDPVISVYGPSYAVAASTPQEQLASWVFLKWLVSPENQARFVEASGAFPTRAASTALLHAYSSSHPQWAAAVEMLPSAYAEPALPSWGRVRWAVSDAATQLFRWYFSTGEIPGLLEILDQTAADLHGG